MSALSLTEHCQSYRNSWLGNLRTFRAFDRHVRALPWLKAHRDWVERHRHGYGHRAFHALWHAVLSDLAARTIPLSVLEIGVFKGQTVSLSALIAQKLGVDIEVTALSPFVGDDVPTRSARRAFRWLTNADFRRRARLGNVHPGADHLADVRRIYQAFELDFEALRVVRGRSQDPSIAARFAQQRFSLVFIDGDHSYDGARFDIEHYTPLITPGGYALIDDAAYFLPGFGYSKGFESVSRACRWLEESKLFRNVINVGKMRVFERLQSSEASSAKR